MPARLRDIKRVLEALGVFVEEPTSGSHWKARGADGKTYPIPAHNGLKEEVSDIYIRALCRSFELDEKSFRSKL